jgi:hypothetical protein
MSQRVEDYPPVLRAELSQLRPLFDLPKEIIPNVTLRAPDQAPTRSSLSADIPNNISAIIDIYSIDEARAIPLLLAVISTLRIGSASALWLRRYTLNNGMVIDGFDGDGHHWGHYDETLSFETVAWVESHFEDLKDYYLTDTYSRVANAIRLHGASLNTPNSDLALLGFVGAIESLFSIAEQELSFRLSFLLAKFLGDEIDQQRNYFVSARELYSVRSKIAHGSQLHEDEEQAAIQMAKRWTPRAEELARSLLRRIADQGLLLVFSSPEQHRKLLDRLLFEPDLHAALEGDR